MMLEYFGVKFLKHKFEGLDGKLTVTFQEQTEPPSADPFRVLVTRSGMNFSGKLSREISTNRELEDFARLIGDAWGEHTKLAPKITRSLSGH